MSHVKTILPVLSRSARFTPLAALLGAFLAACGGSAKGPSDSGSPPDPGSPADQGSPPDMTPPEAPPTVIQVPLAQAPQPPAGNKVVCESGPNTLGGAGPCSVLSWRGSQYWAFSYDDNRVGMAIVAYDGAGHQQQEWERTGARYVYRIDVDAARKQVAFHGQSDDTITMDWSELRLP